MAIQFNDKYTRMPASLFDPTASRHFLLFSAIVKNINCSGGRKDRSAIAGSDRNDRMKTNLNEMKLI